MRLALMSFAVLLAAILGGCGEFAHVRVGDVPKPGTARLVYGLDASSGPLDLALEYHAIGGGSCAPVTKAENTKGATGIEYFAFDVTPGAYAISVFNTTPGLALNGVRQAGYFVAANQQNFIGTFRLPARSESGLSELMARQHDLNIAKTALGPAAASLELASTIAVEGSGWALCSP